MMIIAFDEAGNTGQNLTDEFQKNYVLGSINFSDEEINYAYSTLRGNSDELHFKRMKKYGKYREKLIEFLNSELIQEAKVKYSITDKRFMILCTIVDELISKGASAQGIDIFKNGFDFIICNRIYKVVNSFNKNKEFNQVLNLFIEMVKNKNIDKKELFYKLIQKIASVVERENDKLLFSFWLDSFNSFDETINQMDNYTVDPTMGVLYVLIDWWGKELDENFDVLHDTSKPVNYWKPRIDFLSQNNIIIDEKSTVNLKFPLKINQFKFGDSKESKRLQLADIIASAVNFGISLDTKKTELEVFKKQILNTRLFKITNHKVIYRENPKIKLDEIENEDTRKDFMELYKMFYN